MKAIFLKELRENAKWALLIMLGLGALMTYPCQHDNEPPLVSWEMHAVTAVGFAAAGFVLGLLQVLQDNWRGRWGFLVQRPISRTRIFFGKLLAGIVLYLPSTAIPLGAVTFWIATPGHYAMPFDWHMVVPRLADLIGGLVWYPAGLLVAGRQARWIGSRLFPAGLAFLAALFAGNDDASLLDAMASHAIAMLILLPAAWGAFVSGGEYEIEPILVRITQGISVAFGVLIVYMLALALIGNFVPFPQIDREYPRYAVMDDGRVVVARYTNIGIASAADLQGHALSEEDFRNFASKQLSMASLFFSQDHANGLETGGLQNNGTYARPLQTGADNAKWFYVPTRRTVEGYDRRTCRYVGAIGPHNFSPPGQSPEAFPDEMLKNSLTLYTYAPIIAGASGVYSINFGARQAHELLAAGPADPIIADGEMTMDYDRPAGMLVYPVVLTRSSVHVFKDGAEVFSVPLEHNYPEYNSLEIGQANDGRFALWYESAEMDGKPPASDWVEQVDSHGQILARTELPPFPPSGSTEPRWVTLTEAGVMPPGALAAVLISKPNDPDLHWTAGLYELIIIGVLSAFIALLLMVRYDSSAASNVIWTAICFVLGFPGILLLLCMRQPVAKEPCPSCGKPRLVSRDLCEHCGRAFEQPKREGIEVLEMTGVGAQ